jgi:hypothetical protein
MVEYRDTEQGPSLPSIVRQLHVVNRRRWIRRGVIVDQDDGGSAGPNSVAKAIRETDRSFRLAPLINERRVDQPTSTIE